MKKINLKKGFTLIELLVVVAIIGLLAAVVLAALTSGRAKGADAAVKSNLKSAMAQAALFYEARGTYFPNDDGEAVCVAGSIDGVNSIHEFLLAAHKASGAVALDVRYDDFPTSGSHPSGDPENVVCFYDENRWAADAPLKSGGKFCVDSTGKAEAGAVNSSGAYCSG